MRQKLIMEKMRENTFKITKWYKKSLTEIVVRFKSCEDFGHNPHPLIPAKIKSSHIPNINFSRKLRFTQLATLNYRGF